VSQGDGSGQLHFQVKLLQAARGRWVVLILPCLLDILHLGTSLISDQSLTVSLMGWRQCHSKLLLALLFCLGLALASPFAERAPKCRKTEVVIMWVKFNVVNNHLLIIITAEPELQA
jgi:hypothetical protein